MVLSVSPVRLRHYQKEQKSDRVRHFILQKSDGRRGNGLRLTFAGGPWANVANRYLGLRFAISGEFHYGWARLTVRASKNTKIVTAVLTGYAYETIPDKPDHHRETKGPHDISVEGSDAAVHGADSHPPNLGLLAMGSPGLSLSGGARSPYAQCSRWQSNWKVELRASRKARGHFKAPHHGEDFRFLQKAVGFLGSQQDGLYELVARRNFPL